MLQLLHHFMAANLQSPEAFAENAIDPRRLVDILKNTDNGPLKPCIKIWIYIEIPNNRIISIMMLNSRVEGPRQPRCDATWET